jgi:hypothetical protein
MPGHAGGIFRAAVRALELIIEVASAVHGTLGISSDPASPSHK